MGQTGDDREIADLSAPRIARRNVLKTGVAAAVGAAAWQAPDLRFHDLRGARALAAASGPLVVSMTASSFSRMRRGRTFQHWGNGSGSTFWTVPTPTGNVQIRMRRRATATNASGGNADGQWQLFVNTIPDGCTSCAVTAITMFCPSGTADVTGVPGTSGLAHCNSSPPSIFTAVTATFTITCT